MAKTFKEMQFRPNIAEHDFQVKLKQIKGFLEKGLQVRITLMVRGRQNLFKDEALLLLDRIITETTKLGKADPNRKQEGNNILMTISPSVKQKGKREKTNKYQNFSRQDGNNL